MTQSIRNWLSTSTKTSITDKRKKVKSICVISTNSSENNSKIKVRKRKRNDTAPYPNKKAKKMVSEKPKGNFTVSCYGRKRKKVNYKSLASLWGLKEESESESEESEESEDKQRSVNKRSPFAKAEMANNLETIKHKREKVMTQFRQQIQKRYSEDQRLFGGKKANPYFERLKCNTNTKSKQHKNGSKTAATYDCPVFPQISSVKPEQRTKSESKQEWFRINCADLIGAEESRESHNSAKQSFEFECEECFECFEWQECEKRELLQCDIIQQTQSEFPDIESHIIESEVLFCSNKNGNDSNDSNEQLWCDKYRPGNVSQIMGNHSPKRELKRWLESWTEECSDEDYSDEYNEYNECTVSNTVLVTGPIACGKTASIYAIASELGYHIIEVDCTTIKSAKDLNHLIREATQSQTIHVRCIVLFEEIDTMLESTPTIINAITDVLYNSRCPILLTAQKIPKSLQSLNIVHFEFNYASLQRLSLRTYTITLSQHILALKRSQIERIILFFENDLRSVLTNLQFWLNSSQTYIGETYQQIIGFQNQSKSIAHSHILNNECINDIIFHSFPIPTITIAANQSLPKHIPQTSNCNTFVYEWTHSNNESNICEKEKGNKSESAPNSGNSEWLTEWCTMIDTLSDNDICCNVPHGCTLNSTYHSRLHPHTHSVFDEPLRLIWEEKENETEMESEIDTQTIQSQQQIYDTTQCQYLKHYISPFLVTLALRVCSIAKNDKLILQICSNEQSNDECHILCEIYESFDCICDCPTSKAWFDYYNDFIATICINEYHREIEGGSQYKNGIPIRRSQRSRRNTALFQHIFEQWLTENLSQRILQKWKYNFTGMGWNKDTLPIL